jgi:phosphotransferase system enzyme I (PtsP)
MAKEHFDLLSDIGELHSWISDHLSSKEILTRIVELISKHLKANICSIYLFDKATDLLTLEANIGFGLKKNERITLKSSEGIVGLCIRELRTINIKNASENKHFKPVHVIKEEKYDAYLAIPILKGLNRTGVILLQRESKNPFTDEDRDTLKIISSQLVNLIDNILLLDLVKQQDKVNIPKLFKDKEYNLIKGKIAAGGRAEGKTLLYELVGLNKLYSDSEIRQTYTQEQFRTAVAATRKQIQDLQEEVQEKLTEIGSQIFSGHMFILEDENYIGLMEKKIAEGTDPYDAIYSITIKYIKQFSASNVPLIKEKAQDMEDLGKRLLENLIFKKKQETRYKDLIIIADDLFPSDILLLASELISGIILVHGGVTSHVALLAQSLKIPMIIANEPALLTVSDGTPALLDAETGNIFINPTKDIALNFHEQIEAEKALTKKPIKDTVTKDNVRIDLYTNINLLADIKIAQQIPAAGIGLYRTEFPFIIRNDFPTEEEQYRVYRKLVESMGDVPVTFRTLDIGGDKILPFFQKYKEKNPFLGMRSIRFSLSHQDIFKQQIRAILRAGHGAKLKLMFPMISGMDEYLESKKIVKECIKELKELKQECHTHPEIGIMVEIPSIIPVLGDIAQKCDFFSIGTNDLIQYLLAVDRTNEEVAQLYLPHHPAVLRTMAEIIKIANSTDTPCSICGEMAHQTQYIPFLLGVGYRMLSINPRYFYSIQKQISSISISKAEKLTEKILGENSVSKIEKILHVS